VGSGATHSISPPHASAEAHAPPLAHHFESLSQQFDASKLGMWIFLVTEVLLFAGLFCLYAIYRANHPEIFAYGQRYLDVGWGALNTAVLIFSSFTMATAVYAAQKGDTRSLVIFLSLTLLGGVDFLGIKFVEYSHKIHENLVWGARFYVDPHPRRPEPSATLRPEVLARPGAPQQQPGAPTAAAAAQPTPKVLPKGNVKRGRELFRRTCAACHGMRGQGIPGQGKDMRVSEFIAGLDDAGLLAFVKRGRLPTDPRNTTGKLMPPKGGNPMFTDQDLMDIIAYVRVIQKRGGRRTAAPGGSEGTAGAGAGAEAPTQGTAPAPEPQPLPPEPEFIVPRSILPPAPSGPSGVALAGFEPGDTAPQPAHKRAPPDPRHDPAAPPGLHIFFAIYFCMTGLHGLHVAAGLVVITWLLARTLRGDFSEKYYTPVDLGGLYWHLVDLIWIFLFPLLYLIH